MVVSSFFSYLALGLSPVEMHAYVWLHSLVIFRLKKQAVLIFQPLLCNLTYFCKIRMKVLILFTC